MGNEASSSRKFIPPSHNTLPTRKTIKNTPKNNTTVKKRISYSNGTAGSEPLPKYTGKSFWNRIMPNDYNKALTNSRKSIVTPNYRTRPQPASRTKTLAEALAVANNNKSGNVKPDIAAIESQIYANISSRVTNNNIRDSNNATYIKEMKRRLKGAINAQNKHKNIKGRFNANAIHNIKRRLKEKVDFEYDESL